MQGATSFLIKNIKHNQCMQASLQDGNLHIKNCNTNSKLQHWLWKDEFLLVNQGTVKCLSVCTETGAVQTASCENTNAFKWKCNTDRLLSWEHSKYLSANISSVFLSEEKNKNSKWMATGGMIICNKSMALTVKATSKPGASISSFAGSPEGNLRMGASANKTMGMSPAQLTQLLWFFREEDPTLWNYSIIALALVALLCGLLVLGFNIMANRSRKAILQYQVTTQAQKTNESTDQSETKKALLSLNSDESFIPTEEQTHPFSNTEPGHGNIVVQWKDGNTTTLFKEGTEYES